MKKTLIATAPTLIGAALVAGPALAHPGHYAESHGHAHWFALGALALAAAIGAVAVWRTQSGKSAKKTERKV